MFDAQKLKVVQEVRRENTKALLAELKVCGSTRNLERGKQIHANAIKCGKYSCIYFATALVNMYSKCGSMGDARQVFDCIQGPDLVAWNALILGYAENGKGVIALDLFARMKSQGCAPNSITFVAALKACTSLAVKEDESGKVECRERGRKIRLEIGCHLDIYVQSSLINMYSKCRSMVEARQVFDGMKHPNVVSWTALILGYAENGECSTALELFSRMKSQGCAPNSITFVAVLKACNCKERGREIHSQIGCHAMTTYVRNSLIDMYAKCGSMVDARHVFNGIKHPEVVSWNAIIFGYADNGEGVTALDLFSRMKSIGCVPDSITFVAVLKACTSLALKQDEGGKAECRERGNQIRSEIGCHSDIYVQSTLIDMYAKCGSMVDARQVFDGIKHPNVVSWTALILGYAENGQGIIALDLFARMKSQGCSPNAVTFIAALKSCTSFAVDGKGRAECRIRGKQIHLEIGCDSNNYVKSTLIDMYTKCGSMVEAHQVFNSIRHPDVVAWNALILGYVENGDGVKALDLFASMRSQGCAPNSLTLAAALKACGLVGALECGCKIHAEIQAGAECNSTILINCLVDFYARCGSLAEAQKVFDSHPKTRNLVTWNALLAGYSRVGDNRTVFRLFEGMQDAGFQPDRVTFLSILTCCSHAGLVEKANELFEAISTNYGITPSLEHYNCMVDILGRSNKLDDAMTLLQSMPYMPNVVTWSTVLGACRKWKNVELGRLAFNSLVRLDATNAAAYELMAWE